MGSVLKIARKFVAPILGDALFGKEKEAQAKARSAFGLPAPATLEKPDVPEEPEKVKVKDVPVVKKTSATGRKRRLDIKTTPTGLGDSGLLSAKKKLLGR